MLCKIPMRARVFSRSFASSFLETMSLAHTSTRRRHPWCIVYFFTPQCFLLLVAAPQWCQTSPTQRM